mgnify:CR=1 FL=1
MSRFSSPPNMDSIICSESIAYADGDGVISYDNTEIPDECVTLLSDENH